MRAEGLEPPRAFAHRLLSHATGARAPYLRAASRSWSAFRRPLQVRCYPICYPRRRARCAPGHGARAPEWTSVDAVTDAAQAPGPTMRSRLLRHGKEASGRASPRLLVLVPSATLVGRAEDARIVGTKRACRDTCWSCHLQRLAQSTLAKQTRPERAGIPERRGDALGRLVTKGLVVSRRSAQFVS
jgi:hypothetical protein